ncbi:MAG: ABC transporter permease [Xanthomonadaceae bacterium]|nr:ABC transporter permease [Xanthomonadaceae bacterium]MDP2184166.1 ABC transporter permease [Xanthomonadales bacterium]MDZ4114440.1 ABC transporter permease [Xanthomonadaceae bacterium]MDZ4376741.1 ABC transporter permease [Xanthomonadaceae bacterium]
MSAQPPVQVDPESGNRLLLAGRWTLAEAGLRQKTLARDWPHIEQIDAQQIEQLDSAGALLLVQLLGRLHLELSQVSLSPAHQPLLAAIAAASQREGIVPEPHSGLRDLLARVGDTTVGLWLQTRMLLGFIGLNLSTLARSLVHPRRLRLTAMVHHIEATSLDAVPLIAVLCFLIGAVVAFLGSTVLATYGATIFVVELVGFSFLREFGVLLTAIVVAGRTASAFTAQIGAMKSREEIDAIRTLGLDPIELLVLPRMLAMLIGVPLLTFVAMIAGIAGGLTVAAVSLDITPEAFLTRFHDTVALRHFLIGLGKAPVFAVVISLIGCLEGFKVEGTAQSVGERTTSSVVQSIASVIVLDAMAAVFFMEMDW